ncbi:MAG: M48 family metallopeptidase [Alphaproteobacteria bacterium]|nr:M48 family metallopeptidase [Alphaproteobacteria bacterium]
MLMPRDVYQQLAANNRKLAALVMFFPLALAAFVYVFLRLFESIYNASNYQDLSNNVRYEPVELLTHDNLMLILAIVLIVAFLIVIFSFTRGKNLIFSLTGAQPCPQDSEHIAIFQAVENVALAAGLPTPKVYLIDDKAMNAFATGYSPKDAAITLTTGLVERLTPLELEAVIAHEMGHIMNRDIRLNLFIITGIGVIGLLGEILLRVRSRGNSRGKGGGAVIIFLAVGFGFYLFRLLVAPFIHMAISRTQEFQADATSAHLTRHPQALIDALVKISENPTVPTLANTRAFASMCIFSPLKNLSHLLDTHPSIEERIRRLQEMS